MSLRSFVELLSYLNFGATVFLLVQLVARRTFREYPFFFTYWLADVAEIIGAFGMPRTVAYTYFYAGSKILKTVLAGLVVIELYRVGLEGRPALAKFGQQAAGYVLLIAAVAAALGIYFGPAPASDRLLVVHQVLSFERTLDSAMVVFLLALGLFLSWFPMRIRRNVAIYIGGFAAYFLAKLAATLAANTWYPLTRVFNVADLAFTLLCLLAWIFLMKREGETEQVMTGRPWNPEEMGRLTGKLDALNARLMRIP